MSIYPEKTIKEVLKKLDVETVLKLIDYRTDTIQITGNTVKCFCPIHKEQVFRTLIINPKDKTYRCSYSLCPGNKGGDLISLYALSRGTDYDDGLSVLVKELGIDIDLPTTQEFIDKTVEVAENYLELGVLDEAEKSFSKVAEIQPNNLDTHKGLLEIYTKQANKDKAEKELRKVADILISTRKFEEAKNYCNQILEKAPEQKESHYLMLECYLGLEEYQEALGEYMTLADLHEMKEEFDKALECYHKIEDLGLDIIDVYPHIINVLVASNRTEEAIDETIKRADDFRRSNEMEKTLDCYRYILELDPDRNDIRKDYIELALETGLTEERIDESLKIVDEILNRHALGEALEALNSLVTAAPDNPRIIEKLINVYLDQGKEEEAENLQLRLSEIHENAGRMEEAKEPLNDILSRKPDSTEAYSHLSDIAYMQGEKEKAKEHLKKIVSIFKEKGDLDNAVATYDRLINIEPDEVTYKEEQIELLLEDDKKDNAFQKCLELVNYLEAKKQNELLVQKLRFALELKPDEVDLIIRLADQLNKMKRLTEARDEYYRAFEVLEEKGKHAQAATQLQRCIDIDPSDKMALFQLGETFIEIGETRKALKHLQDLADLHIEETNLEDAQKVLQKILTIQPDDINTMNQLADIYRNLGYENEMVETYERMSALYLEKEAFNKVIEISGEILKIRSQNITAYERLIDVYEQTSRSEEAVNLLFKLADIYEEKENLDKEEECYERILKKDNTNMEARRRHIFLLLKLSHKQAAYREARILSDQYTMRKEIDEAISLYRKLIEQNPEDLPLHLHLLELYKKAERKDDVIQELERIIDLYEKREEKAVAVEYYQELIDFAPNETLYRAALIDLLTDLERLDESLNQTKLLAQLHMELGELDEAEAALQKMQEVMPENPELFRLLIELNKIRGTLDQAIDLIRSLAEIHKKADRIPDAIETLREVFEFDALNVETHKQIIELQKSLNLVEETIETYLSLYEVFQNTGSMEDAVNTLREVVGLKPEDAKLRQTLVDAYLKSGMEVEAIDELFHICNIHKKSEEYEAVLETLDRINEIDPENLRSKKNRAETYALMGDEKKALAEFLKISSDLEKIRAVTPAAGTSVEEENLEQSGNVGELPIVEDYTFDSFVVGSHNNFAYATAMAVAKAPAQNYNPLFLCSDVGLGKTHLIHAIANYIMEHVPDMRILYTNSEEFTTQLIDAIQNNTILQFRARHKNTDLLLLDDVQFLAGKERAQEEFFHLFNTLFQAKKQIVITSDRPPKDIAHLEKRLKSRFGAGIIVDIQPPDMVTRAAILKRERDNMPDAQISDQLINIIAEKVDTNIRDLKGAYNQIIARQRITSQPVTESMVRQILDSLFEKV